MAVDHIALGPPDLPDQGRLEQDAVVRERPVRRGHLDRGHGELVAHREARRAEARPLHRRAQATCGLGRKLDSGGRAEPEIAQRGVLRGGCQAGGELDDRDVARNPDRIREREFGKRLLVHDGAPGQAVTAAFAGNAFIRRHEPPGEQRARGEDLRDGPGLEGVGEGARTHRAVAAPRGHGQHFSRGGIEHHHVSAVGLGAPHGVVERALCDVLQLRVECEYDVAPGDRWRDHARWRLVLAAGAILQHHGRPRSAGEHAVQHQLEPRGPASVVPDAPDDRVRQLRARIEAVHHRLEMDAAHGPERLDLDCAERTGEIGVASGQRLPHVREREVQLPGEGSAIPLGIAQLIGSDADVVGLLREGERRAVAVEKRAAARGQHDVLRALYLRLAGPALPLDQLHLSRPSDQGHQADEHRGLDHLEADREFGHRSARPAAGRGKQDDLSVTRESQPQPDARAAQQHGAALGSADPALEVGTMALEVGALLPQRAEVACRANGGGLARDHQPRRREEDEQPERRPVTSSKRHRSAGMHETVRSARGGSPRLLPRPGGPPFW